MARLSGSISAPIDLRLDQERPGQDRDGRRQDRRVDQAAAVTAGEPAPDQQEEAERDERVAGEVQDVGDRRERVLADDLEPVPDEVAGHEQRLTERHEQPRRDALRAVRAGRRASCQDDRGRPDGVVQEALRQRAGLEHRVHDERERPGCQVGEPRLGMREE